MRGVVFSAVIATALFGCKKAPEAPPREGWVQSEGMSGACFFPKNYAALGATDRKIARQQALEQMLSQWSGKRNDGVSFDERMVEQVETTLLGEPAEIEAASAENAALCEVFMKTSNLGPWSAFLDALPEKLTAGECKSPLVNRQFNYLDIASGWQNRANVCAGQPVQIIASSIDYYRLSDKGPWINVDGDPNQPAHATELPCNLEGCFAGQLVLRFTPEDGGTSQVVPVGHGLLYTPPGHGAIEIAINDSTWHDNRYKVEQGLEHHASIEYSPK